MLTAGSSAIFINEKSLPTSNTQYWALITRKRGTELLLRPSSSPKEFLSRRYVGLVANRSFANKSPMDFAEKK